MQLDLPDVIQEHGRLNFAQPEAWMVLLLGAAYVWALWQTRNWRVTWLLPLLWLYLACDRVRHAPLFAVVAALALAEILPVAQALKRRSRFLAPCAAMILLALLLQTAGLRVPVVGAGWARLDSRLWPVELLPELRRLESQSATGTLKVFNSLRYGGFLMFHTPRLQTFIDDRCELFGDAFLREYAHAERNAPQQIDIWQRQYGFQYALVRSGSPLDAYLATHPQWQLVRRASAALYRLD
jgi:hypothetical protein